MEEGKGRFQALDQLWKCLNAAHPLDRPQAGCLPGSFLGIPNWY
jgi:hypothetical protein